MPPPVSNNEASVASPEAPVPGRGREGAVPDNAVVTVTPKAVEKIRQAFKKMGVSDLQNAGLRLGVLGGGCTGLSYQFKFDTKPRTTDNIFKYDDVQIFIDPKSLLYLRGLTLDYKESLMQSGFVFDNPNAKKNCGCGSSFSA
jgi:iron-sulfur cluster assembly protein